MMDINDECLHVMGFGTKRSPANLGAGGGGRAYVGVGLLPFGS